MEKLYYKRFKLEFENDVFILDIEKEIEILKKSENAHNVSADIKNPIIIDKDIIIRFHVTLA